MCVYLLCPIPPLVVWGTINIRMLPSQYQSSLFMVALKVCRCLCASGIEHVLLLLHLLLDHPAYSGTYSCPLISLDPARDLVGELTQPFMRHLGRRSLLHFDGFTIDHLGVPLARNHLPRLLQFA